MMSSMVSWQKIQSEFTGSDDDKLSVSALIMELSLLFERYFGREQAKERFSLPSGYITFLNALRSTHVSQTVGGWDFMLYGPSSILANTTYSCDLFAKDEHIKKSGMWIEIGAYNDKHTFFLCCDRGRSLFRHIYDGHDDHPWLNGAAVSDFKSIEALLNSLRRR